MRLFAYGWLMAMCAAAAAGPAAGQTADSVAADMVLTGGTVRTMDEDLSVAEAVAIAGGRIIFVGSSADAEVYITPSTTRIDLDGSTVFPGFVDAHAHLDGLGKLLVQVNLNATGSAQECRERVLEWRSKSPPGDWIQGRGWDQNDWDVKEFPTWRDLEGTESHAVYLRRIDGHAAWVNKTALDRCGITAETADPYGGRIIRDADGKPTGVLIDEAMSLVSDKIPEASFEDRLRRVQLAIAECQRNGLTGIHDAGVDREGYEVLRYLAAREELDFRLYEMLDADDSTFAVERIRKGPVIDNEYLVVRSLKLYADGALGSRGAAMIEPYSDDAGNAGLLMHPREALLDWTSLALANGFQVCTHAIGDRGNRIILDVYEEALGRVNVTDPRLRVEHAQIIHPGDLGRFNKLGVIPSMQPTHATSDMYWAEDRVGPERIKGGYAWRSLIDSGCVIPCGSDFPVEGVNPLWGIYAAVTRQDHSGWPTEGWFPGQRMTIEEAVAGFTRNAAYARFQEHVNGTIEVGKMADLTILSKDLMAIPAAEILQTGVVMTVVGGKVMYSSATEGRETDDH